MGYAFAWSGLNGLFRHDDLTVVNRECAVSNLGSAIPKQFIFRWDPRALPAMAGAGVEVANLGNNHSHDFGPAALVDTVRNVRRAGIAPVGAGATSDEAPWPADLLQPGQLRVAELLVGRLHHGRRRGDGHPTGGFRGRLLPAFITAPGHPVLR